MKLERIALSGFLSHADTDWSPNGARLVSLVGANGAGKSSMLDGVAYALFDEARARTDDLVKLGATNMSATVEFGFAGARYRVTRGRSTRAGGKTFLELHMAVDGGWMPLTGDTIRDTQDAIAELLRLDASTFKTAVLLGQGEANRFAQATAAERKRVLGQILQLDVYARAEEVARQRARELEARSSADQAALARLADAIVELGTAGEIRDRALVEATRLEAVLEDRASARKAATAILEGLTTRQAAAAAQAADVDRVEREVAALVDRYRRTKGRQEASSAALAGARATLETAAVVEAAVADLPAARAEVANLVAGEAEDRRIRTAIAEQRETLAGVQRPHDEAVTTWRTKRADVLARIATLEEHVRAGASICEACGQAIDEEAALAQLARARAERDALGEEPKMPLAIARETAALTRLESRQRELGWDPAVLIAARDRLTELERTAARGEAIAAARATVEREEASIEAAAAELEEIGRAGTAARARLEELNAASAAQADLGRQVAGARDELARIVAAWERADAERRDLDRRIATLEANVARLAELQDEHALVEARLAAAELELGRLWRLVAAFGVSGIPARIIESVLPELGAYANELLGQLRPGVSLELRAQRAKKDGKGVVEALDLIVRDDAGERPLALFSGGERMSVSLALAVGLSRLVARRAGTAIRTLVIDEPDGLDADARRAFGQALRILAHHGELERVVLVSHHPDLAEYADEVYQVTKDGRGSAVALVE